MLQKSIYYTARVMKNNVLVVLALGLIDVSFLFVLGFATAPVVDRLLELSFTLTTGIGQVLQQLDSFSVWTLVSHSTLQPLVLRFVLYTLLAGLIAYVVYGVLQGLAWHLSRRLLMYEVKRFFLRFFLVNLPWFISGLVLFFALLYVDLRYTLIASLTSTTKPVWPFIPFYILLVALVYFALISYGSLNVRYAFRLGLRRWKLFVPMMVVIAGSLAFAQVIIYSVNLLSPFAGFVVGLALFPLLSFIRLFSLATYGMDSHD
ncbi:hypothetical protein GF342_00100 [Candidatus Woesearchaeota archaeon]|nr:hypothetical protein [Candidatus Woesearchaeota archaeon]